MQRRIIAFVGALSVAIAISACGGGSGGSGTSAGEIAKTLSANGDVSKGEAVFQNSACSSCHTITTEQLVGPGLAGVMTTEGPTHPEGVSYNGNLPNGQPRTDENVATWIKEGGQGQIGVMPAQAVSDADMPDLLAYLHSLTK